MDHQPTSGGRGLSKQDLLLEFWAFRPRFLAYIRRKTFSHDTTEDIFQEACLKFLAANVVFLIPQAATKYFCRIIRSLIVNQIREMSRLEYRADLPEAVCEPQAELEKYILSDQIWEIAQRLPLKDRRLLDLYFDSDGSSFGEQCKALDISPSAARYRIGKIIAKLRIMTNGKT